MAPLSQGLGLARAQPPSRSCPVPAPCQPWQPQAPRRSMTCLQPRASRCSASAWAWRARLEFAWRPWRGFVRAGVAGPVRGSRARLGNKSLSCPMPTRPGKDCRVLGTPSSRRQEAEMVPNAASASWPAGTTADRPCTPIGDRSVSWRVRDSAIWSVTQGSRQLAGASPVAAPAPSWSYDASPAALTSMPPKPSCCASVSRPSRASSSPATKVLATAERSSSAGSGTAPGARPTAASATASAPNQQRCHEPPFPTASGKCLKILTPA